MYLYTEYLSFLAFLSLLISFYLSLSLFISFYLFLPLSISLYLFFLSLFISPLIYLLISP